MLLIKNKYRNFEIKFESYIHFGVLEFLSLFTNFHFKYLFHLNFHFLHFVIVLSLLFLQLRQRVPANKYQFPVKKTVVKKLYTQYYNSFKLTNYFENSILSRGARQQPFNSNLQHL